MVMVNEASFDPYEEIVIEDKFGYYMKNGLFDPSEKKFNRQIECIHCGRKFKLKEFKVVRSKADGQEFIMCKHYPECDGSMIDFVPY